MEPSNTQFFFNTLKANLMNFYPINKQIGTAVPGTVWATCERLMNTKVALPKVTFVCIIRDIWKLESPETCGLLVSKQFVEWMADKIGYSFYQY